MFVNLEGAERIYTKGAGPMCPRDGYVLFRNSELLCGRLGKQTLGGGNKASLFQARAAAPAVAFARTVASHGPLPEAVHVACSLRNRARMHAMAPDLLMPIPGNPRPSSRLWAGGAGAGDGLHAGGGRARDEPPGQAERPLHRRARLLHWRGRRHAGRRAAAPQARHHLPELRAVRGVTLWACAGVYAPKGIELWPAGAPVSGFMSGHC